MKSWHRYENRKKVKHMNNEKIEKLIRTKEAKKQELAKHSEEVKTVEELRSIHDRIKEINAEIEELRGVIKQDGENIADRTKAVNEKEGAVKPEARGKQIADPEHGFESRGRANLDGAQTKESAEARNREYGKNLKEGRSITVSGGTIVLPQHTSDTINPSFLQSSNLIDLVKQVPIPGGETYSQPYEISTDDAAYTAEGAEAAAAEVKFSDIKVTK